jgi:hypothetical protein
VPRDKNGAERWGEQTDLFLPSKIPPIRRVFVIILLLKLLHILLHAERHVHKHNSILASLGDDCFRPRYLRLVVAARPLDGSAHEEAQHEGGISDRRVGLEKVVGVQGFERSEDGVADQLHGLRDAFAVVRVIPVLIAGDEVSEAFDVLPEGGGVGVLLCVLFVEGKELSDRLVTSFRLHRIFLHSVDAGYSHDSQPPLGNHARNNRYSDIGRRHLGRAFRLHS